MCVCVGRVVGVGVGAGCLFLGGWSRLCVIDVKVVRVGAVRGMAWMGI